MLKHHVSESTIITAPAERVYAILADYRVGHPGILPQPPFHSYEVEAGGQGAGTIIRFKMTAMGRTESFRGVVTEPEPGRVLVETYSDSKTVTTFTVEPLDDGTHCRRDIRHRHGSPWRPVRDPRAILHHSFPAKDLPPRNG